MGTMLHVYVLVICAMTVITSAYQNTFDGDLLFECPSHDQTVSHVKSVHDNDAEDRVFDFQCRTLDVEISATPVCTWTEYMNEFDELLHFECPQNGYITGLQSVHSNKAEDRRWKFQCCQIPAIHLADCEFSGFANDWDGLLEYSVPDGTAMKGVISIHDNGKEDRRYEFVTCTLEYRSEEAEIG